MDKKYHKTFGTLNNDLDKEQDNENEPSRTIEVTKKNIFIT